ncbi:MAG: bis(5'-nucleosyl)-tetraphosphatase (symmetrical) YqeK [Treponema sp.]|nr:bis(5'-nucleosyl)-tetraphosphatase (symmetrical) YqeK [Treponema sp.]
MDTMTDIDELTERIRKYTMACVTQSRYEHSVRTAQTCVKLCELSGVDPKMGFLAGICHDMCKCMDADVLKNLAKKDGQPFADIEERKPGLLHGRAAAVMIQSEFGITDPDLIEAVANHTFGKPGMCDLAKILFVADKIEPGRDHITKEYLKKMYKLPLDKMVYTVVKENVDYVEKKGNKVSDQTYELLRDLEESGAL